MRPYKLPNYQKKKTEELDALQAIKVEESKKKKHIIALNGKIREKKQEYREIVRKPAKELKKIEIKKRLLTHKSDEVKCELTEEKKTLKDVKRETKSELKSYGKKQADNEKAIATQQCQIDTIEAQIVDIREKKNKEETRLKELIDERMKSEKYNEDLEQEIKEKQKELLAIDENKKHLLAK